jgi:glycosyltransferase involved in cell wall biosynthesis
MRIWAFPSFYPFDRPGLLWTGIFAHRQYKGLLDNGADLKVILPVPWSPPFPFYYFHEEWKKYAQIGYPDQGVFEGVPIYYPRISNIRPNRFVKSTFEERFIDSIVNFFREQNIVPDPSTDIFFSQWTPNSVMVQRAAHKLGVRSAILCIGDDVMVYPHEKPESYDRFKQTWVEADMRYVVADYLGKEANRVLGMNLPYGIVYYGVDYDYFKPGLPDEILQTKQQYKIPTDKTIILTIGTAIKRKGWLDLFDALKEIKKVNNDFMQVAIHGGVPEFDLDEEAAKRGLTGNFLNLGEINPGLLNKLYNTADIFCLPSHWEGMANVIMESMSSGLPVLTTSVCGHPEVIDNDVTGILIPPKQPEILAKELLILLNDSAKRKFLGNNARNFIVSKWGNFTDNTKLLYEKLTQGKP